MKIGIDCHVLNGGFQGTFTVLENLLEKLPSDYIYYLYSFDPQYTINKFKQKHFNHKKIIIKNSLLRLSILFPLLSYYHKCDFMLFNYYAPLLFKKKNILIIHDLIYLDFPEYAPRGRHTLFKLFVRYSANKARHIITVSNYSKERIIKNFGIDEKRITVIPNSLSKSWLKPNLDAISQTWNKIKEGFPKKYAITVGRLDTRKNFVQVARVVKELINRNLLDGLVIVGPDDFGSENIFNSIKAENNDYFIKHFSRLSQIELQAAYSNASCLLYLSLAEGFGMPIIEAMAMGTPIVASDRTAIPEVCGNAAIFVNPNNLNEIVNRTSTLLIDSNLKHKLIKNGKERLSKFDGKKSSKVLKELFDRLKNIKN